MPPIAHSARPRKRVYFRWEDLIDYIAESKVIPICGPELLTVTIDGVEQNLISYLNREVARALDVEFDDESMPTCLGDVAYQHLRDEGELRDLYKAFSRVLDGLDIEPPRALRRLARITNFNLFVSTTPDGYLAKAVNLERFGGSKKAGRLAYLNNGSQEQDLPCLRRSIPREQPLIYHLFGYRSTSADYALTDADLLEYITSLHDKARQPTKLFQELRDHHLLFLGTGHTGWMARFLLRTARTTPLKDSRSREELLVETAILEDPTQIHFFDRFSRETKLCPPGEHVTPIEFVDELYQRIEKERPELLISAAPDEVGGNEQGGIGDFKEGSIFLSYASEDRNRGAERLYDQLTQSGLDVWFDKDKLRAGNYENQINQAIRRCSFFIPVISNSSHDPQSFDNRFFRREWSTAIRELLPGKAPEVVKIHPIRIDDVPLSGPGIPPEFDDQERLHAPLAPAGELSADDLQTIIHLYRDWQRRQR